MYVYAMNRKRQLEGKRKLEGTRSRGMEQGERMGRPKLEAVPLLNIIIITL